MMQEIFDIPHLPIGEKLVSGIDYLSDHLDFLFDAISIIIKSMVGFFDSIMSYLPPVVLAAIILIITWRTAKLKVTAFTAVALAIIYSMELWDMTIQTVALIFVATIIALVLGIPIGILKARNKTFSVIVEPILDFMQTLPSLSYLIPAVLFFGIGNSPGVIATVIFAMPPAIRLTCLGIEQVSNEIVEVGKAFGATSRQILMKIELPLAMPSIMMGVNQTIMLACSMVVIAGFIGAGGLGGVIISGLQRYSLEAALEGGISVVFLAIILDRITSKIGVRYDHKKK